MTPVKSISNEGSFTFRDWRIHLHANGNGSVVDWKNDIEQLFPLIEKPQQVLKHDHRSEVGTFTIAGYKYVVKKFTLQDSWFWFQWTSLWFPSIGDIAFTNAIKLSAAGINTPVPILLLQRYRNRMIVGSWLVYRYAEGSNPAPEHHKDIIRFIHNMHDNGWVHRDPHPDNFLVTDAGLTTLDPVKARKKNSEYLKAYDIVLLSHNIPDAVELYGRKELGVWLKMAKLGHNTIRIYRSVKHGIRRAFGFKGSGR